MIDEELEKITKAYRQATGHAKFMWLDQFRAAANPATVLALLERLKKAEAQVVELVREGHKVSLNRDDAVEMLGRVRAERDELNRKLADLERKVLCPNFEHDWEVGSPETKCRRCPATVTTTLFWAPP